MQKRALLYIIFAGILWGTSGLFVNILNPIGLSMLQITAVRGVVSAICMACYAFICDRSLFKVTGKELLLYACSGLAVFLTSACYFISIQASSVSMAVVLMYTAPVFVMIYSVLFMGEKFTSRKLISLVLVMVGSCLVSGVVGGFICSAKGIIFGFGAGLSYSAYNIITKIEMRHKLNPISASMYSFIFMAVVSLVCSQPLDIVKVTDSASAVINMVLCGLCTCVMPYFLYTLSLRTLPVGTASTFGIVEPMAATLLSVMVLGERLNLSSLTGIVLILTAVFLLSRIKE